jgi:protein-S-isoprenylcysteine O-methyltransferase Ste14
MLPETLTAVLLSLPLFAILVVGVRYWMEFRKEQARGAGKQHIGYSKLPLILLAAGYFGMWLSWVGAIVALSLERYYAAFHFLAFPLETPPLVAITGLIVFYAGALLFTWAIAFAGRYLRPSISGVHEDHRLVQDGPLGIVRHPYYVSYVLILLGLGLTLTTFWPLLLALCVVIGMRSAARAEEEQLLALFGDEYEQYRRRVGRFFPRIAP